MPSNDEGAEGTSAETQTSSETVTAAGSSAPAHHAPPLESQVVFVGHVPDGYEIPYGVTVHVLEADETGALHDHAMAEESIARVDPVTHQVQEIYHGQVIDAEHPPQVHEGNPTPEPIFIGQLPDNYELPYGQTVHVLERNEDGELRDHRMAAEPFMRVDPETGDRQTIWHGQVIDPQHPPVPDAASAQTEPVFVGHVPDSYQFQPGLTVHVLEASPDGDGFRDHRMVEEPMQQRDAATGDTLTIWHGAVIDRQHADGSHDEAVQTQQHSDVPSGADGVGYGAAAHVESHVETATVAHHDADGQAHSDD